MTVMVTNQQTAVQPIKTGQLVGIFKAIAPRSFEKTFEGMPVEAINHAMKICIEGLSREQIDLGLRMVRDNGFCPDPAMFRKWCLGITGFGTEQQRAVDSFKGKHAALADIVKWVSDKKHQITNAEKEAYDRCYDMFNDINWAKNVERAQFYAYEAFKENYTDVVSEFVAQGVLQAVWIKPPAIEKKIVADYGDWGGPTEKKEPTDEQKAQTQEYLANLRKLIKRPGEQGLGGGV